MSRKFPLCHFISHTHTGAGEEEGEGGAVCGSMSWHDCNDNKVTLLSAAQQKTSEKKKTIAARRISYALSIDQFVYRKSV